MCGLVVPRTVLSPVGGRYLLPRVIEFTLVRKHLHFDRVRGAVVVGSSKFELNASRTPLVG
jgi:hypothetical protein